jgi:hypothetical protein
MPSEHIQGKQALISIDNNHFTIERVPIPSKEESVLEDTTLLELTEKGIIGSVKRKVTGYFSMDEHMSLTYVNEKNKEQHFTNIFNRGSNKFKLLNFEYPDLTDKNQLFLRGNFTLQDYAKKVAGEWYVNLNLFKFYEHKQIDFPNRKTPIFYPHLSKSRFVTILKIPAGYKVTYLPGSKTFENSVWGFSITYAQEGDSVIMKQEFENKDLLLQPEKFEKWNKVLENLYPLYKESVNLGKL